MPSPPCPRDKPRLIRRPHTGVGRKRWPAATLEPEGAPRAVKVSEISRRPPGSAGLVSQLDALGVKPTDINYVAISHSHPDHIGNVGLFPQAMLLVQKAEYEWPSPFGARFKPEHPVKKLEGDHDVFGDGSVTLIA